MAQYIEKGITTYKEYLPNNRKENPVLIVGGKLDQHKERVILRRDAKKMAKKYNVINYFECSSKIGQNIEKIFQFLTRFMLKYEDIFIKSMQNQESKI